MKTLVYLHRMDCTSFWCWLLISTFLLLPISACSKMSNGQTVKSDAKWDEDVFTVYTACLAETVAAIWRISKEGTPGSPVDLSVSGRNAEDVIEVFNRQPPKRKARGIFIHSRTYAIPDTPEERQMTTEYVYYQLYLNPVWRKSENALVEELQAECKKRGIALYVNRSADSYGPWKKLSP